MPTAIELSGDIGRPIEEVFDFVADFGNEERWTTTGSRYMRVDPGPIGPGTSWRMTGRAFARPIHGTRTITEFRRPEFVESRSDIVIPTLARFRFTPVNSATHVTFTLIADFPLWMRVIAPILIVPQFRRTFRRDFENLKRLLESPT